MPIINVNKILDDVRALGCSDLHFTVGINPVVRLHGQLRKMSSYPEMTDEMIAEIVEQMTNEHQRANVGKKIDTDLAQDHLGYLTKTPNGKLLKSSTIYLKDDEGKVAALFCINFDVSALAVAENVIHDMVSVREEEQKKEPEAIVNNVSDLLDELIQRSVHLVGKPVEYMTKEDKVRAIQFLSNSGALLITKSGDKIANFCGISKYTLYSYLDIK